MSSSALLNPRLIPLARASNLTLLLILTSACDSDESSNSDDKNKSESKMENSEEENEDDTESGENSDEDGATGESGENVEEEGSDEQENNICDRDPGQVNYTEGDELLHFAGLDAQGEIVQLCPLHGKPMVIDVSTEWCGPCKSVANYFSLADDEIPEDIQFSRSLNFGKNGPYLRKMIQEDRITWITLLLQDQTGNPAYEDTTARWEEAYPHDKIISLAVPAVQEISTYMQIQYYPTFSTVNEDFQWEFLAPKINPNDGSYIGDPALPRLIDAYGSDLDIPPPKDDGQKDTADCEAYCIKYEECWPRYAEGCLDDCQVGFTDDASDECIEEHGEYIHCFAQTSCDDLQDYEKPVEDRPCVVEQSQMNYWCN